MIVSLSDGVRLQGKLRNAVREVFELAANHIARPALGGSFKITETETRPNGSLEDDPPEDHFVAETGRINPD